MKDVTPHSKKPIKKRTINLEVSSIKTFLNKAVKWDMISVNPIANIDYLKEDDSKVIRALTEEETRMLLEKANGWFKSVLVTSIYTGMREGELRTLEWDDIDFSKGVIHIRREPGWIPKSSGHKVRERDIAIPRHLADYLREHKKKGKKQDNLVFQGKDGRALKTGLRRALMRLTEKCGFPEVTQFHALRHTYATQLISRCKELTVAKEQLGHSDIRTTMKYSDMNEERKRKAANLLDFG